MTLTFLVPTKVAPTAVFQSVSLLSASVLASNVASHWVPVRISTLAPFAVYDLAPCLPPTPTKLFDDDGVTFARTGWHTPLRNLPASGLVADAKQVPVQSTELQYVTRIFVYSEVTHPPAMKLADAFPAARARARAQVAMRRTQGRMVPPQA